MALETATYIDSLVETWPEGPNDQRSTADDHLRLLKAVLKRTWPQVAGEVSVSHGELNYLVDLTVNVQMEFNRLRIAGANGTASGTVVYALTAGNAAQFGSVSLANFARRDQTNVYQAGQAVIQKDLGTLSGTLNIEPSSANYFGVVLAGDVVSISLGAALTAGHIISIRIQQGNLGTYGITGWPASVRWADGSEYDARTTASAIDLISLMWDGPLAVWLAQPRKFG